MLYRELADNLPTYNVFKDDEETTVGVKWAPRLQRLVKKCRFFVLLVSKDWSTPAIRKRLNDPDNWVRREILAATKSKCLIIPVLVNGAPRPTGLPSDIQSVIDENQCFNFSSGSDKWDGEIAKLCVEITGETRRRAGGGTLTRLFAPLNRHRETPDVRAAVLRKGYAAFALTGGVRDEPLVFAQRCGIEINRETGFDQAFGEPVSLQWKPFAVNNKSLRRKDLLRAIAAGCVLEQQDDIKSNLRDHFRKNQQTLVFFTVIFATGSKSVERILEWLDVWKELLVDCRPGSVVALIFVPRSWLLGRPLHLPTHPCEDVERLQREGLGVIRHDDVDLFVEELSNQGKLSKTQKISIEQAAKRLFWLPFGRRLKQVKETLAPLLTS